MKKYTLYIITTLILLASSVFSQTIYVSGDITTNTTWAADTVKITGDVSVLDTVTLTINPGTYIEFQGYFEIQISGRLLAVGNVNDSITFTINDTTGYSVDSIFAGGWNGIWLTGAANVDTSIISYCNFEFCKGKTIYSTYNSKSIIEYNSLKNIHIGLSIESNSFSIIRYNTIISCKESAIGCETVNYVYNK